MQPISSPAFSATPGSIPSDWLHPDWPAPAHVHALHTTRQGGCSAPPWDSFNLGRSVGDDPAAVEANWRALARAVAGAGEQVRLPWLRQVHGTRVQVLDGNTPSGQEADACMTRSRHVACTVMAADCLAVLLTDQEGSCVAAAHAGWRGLAGGVLEEVVARLRATSPGSLALMAWLGPCIGPTAFEVGPEVRQAFIAQDAQADRHFAPGARPGKYLADLAALARQHLVRAGVTALYGNDSSADWCTVGAPLRFFSHRRDSVRLGSTGRMAASIWMA